jgi:DNA-binding transcriptional LysR family regulator
MSSTYNLIKFQHLHWVVVAADQGSLRGAADILMIRQSTLSRCVRQLEHAVGTPIFNRCGGGVRATEFGQRFLRTARTILEQVDNLVVLGHLNERGELGRLSIGFHTSLNCGNLRETLVEFARRYPEIDISMIECSKAVLTTSLYNGDIDVAIVTGERALPGSKSIPLWSERFIVALPAKHRLAASEHISWADFAGETVLLSRRDPGPAIRELLSAKISSAEDRPHIAWHNVSHDSIVSLVGACLGISLMLDGTYDAHLEGVVWKEIQDVAGSAKITFAASWREDNERAALANFLSLLKLRFPSI